MKTDVTAGITAPQICAIGGCARRGCARGVFGGDVARGKERQKGRTVRRVAILTGALLHSVYIRGISFYPIMILYHKRCFSTAGKKAYSFDDDDEGCQSGVARSSGKQSAVMLVLATMEQVWFQTVDPSR